MHAAEFGRCSAEHVSDAGWFSRDDTVRLSCEYSKCFEKNKQMFTLDGMAYTPNNIGVSVQDVFCCSCDLISYTRLGTEHSMYGKKPTSNYYTQRSKIWCPGCSSTPPEECLRLYGCVDYCTGYVAGREKTCQYARLLSYTDAIIVVEVYGKQGRYPRSFTTHARSYEALHRRHVITLSNVISGHAPI